MSAEKIMLDADFYDDVKVICLWDMKGKAAVFDFLVIIALLRKNHGKLPLNEDATWSLIGKTLAITRDEAKAFVGELLDKDAGGKFSLLHTDGDTFWSDRLLKDIHSFHIRKERIKSAGAAGAKKRWQNDSDAIGDAISTANGDAIAMPLGKLKHCYSGASGEANGNAISAAIAILPPSLSLSERGGGAGGGESFAPNHDPLHALVVEWGEKCVDHYEKTVRAHLAAKGKQVDNFPAYLSNWIRKDKVEAKGWFCQANGGNGSNGARPPNLPQNKIFKAPKDDEELIKRAYASIQAQVKNKQKTGEKTQ